MELKKTEYRPLMNYEIDNLMEGKDIVKFIKVQKSRWFGHDQK